MCDASFRSALRLACAAAILFLTPWLTGCRQGPASQFQQCRDETRQLQQRLAEEQQLRRRTELEMRRMADRLSESEMELARSFDSSLAERPGRRHVNRDTTRLGAPNDRVRSSATPLSTAGSANGWRPSQTSP